VSSAIDLPAWIREHPYEGHELLFGSSHEDSTPAFHRDLIADYWSDAPSRVLLGFRGSGKSTRAEEYLTLELLGGRYRSILIVGPSEQRAVEHLESVSRELQMNDGIRAVFGEPQITTLTQTKIVLRNGRSILAVGRGQNIRGIKQLGVRPELILVDDFEDEENVLTPEGRRAMLRWFLRALRLACHPRWKVRVLATVMDADCVPLLLSRLEGWPVSRYPVSYVDAEGNEVPLWPSRFSLEWITRTRAEYRALGELEGWRMEMECEAGLAAGERVFRLEHRRVVLREHTYEATYCMYDPARTVGRKSSTTGKAVWSWHHRKLIVWDLEAHRWLPDEMVRDVVSTSERWDPVWVGVEQNSLDEWLWTPLREEGERRGVVVPYRRVNAPRDKLKFIEALQLKFEAGEVEFAREPDPDVWSQFMGFPRPPIDAPNALAYALLLRPGRPLLSEFSEECIRADLGPLGFEPLIICVNAGDGWVTGVLVQVAGDRVRIIGDWAYEGLAEERAGELARQVGLAAEATEWREVMVARGLEAKGPLTYRVARASPRWVAPAVHWEPWVNVGLTQALARVPVRPRRGGEYDAGRSVLREGLERRGGGEPLVLVSTEARWTLRALAGGYCLGRDGVEAERGVYRILMEGLESGLALAWRGGEDAPEASERANWVVDRGGRRYVSAMPARGERRVH